MSNRGTDIQNYRLVEKNEREPQEGSAGTQNEAIPKDLLESINELLAGYSKLIASTSYYSLKDYLNITNKPKPIKAIVMLFASLLKVPESKILENGSTNVRRNALGRARDFTDTLVELLGDIDRARQDQFKSMKPVSQMIIHFKETLPQTPKRVFSTSQTIVLIASIVSIGAFLVDYFAPDRILVISLFYVLAYLVVISVGLSAVLFGGILVIDRLWYRHLLKKFEIQNKELRVLNKLRPKTRDFSSWVYSNEKVRDR